MSQHHLAPEGKDPVLWQMAQKRTGFKAHATSYLLVNLFLWAVWYFTGSDPGNTDANKYPWPIWTTIGWGIGLAFHFTAVYVFPRSNAVEREYERLKIK